MAINPANRKLLLGKMSRRRNELTIVANLMLAILVIMVVFEIFSDNTNYITMIMPFILLFYFLSRMELISSKIQLLKAYDTMTNTEKSE